ncbi:xanthine dehydrogenase-like [Pomacea canaliculata]|uniref:xanthine dehydrogenase-like n=1 Tax=Pomacea canaliculata TaxID=400727 RepID=UPI000D72CE17|nr:xanthine dehydrogenase-like [Pomacea canaliculata]
MSDSVDQTVLCPACGTKQDIPPGLAGREEYGRTCISCGFSMKLRLQQGASEGVTFTVNGTQLTVRDEFNPATSLNEYLRRTGVSRGTKQLCIEGGCGVCLVAVKLYEPVSATSQVYAVNSCLVQLYMCDGWEITTIEGLGNVRTGLHAIQKRLTKYNGAQCGFCTPSQVMNMYGLLQRNPTPTMQQVEDAYDVSICRCTGYRPILDAMKSFASDAPPNLQGGMIDIEDLNPKMCKKTGTKCEGKCDNKKDKKRCSSDRQEDSSSIPNVGARAVWFKPTTLQELYTLLHQHRTDNYRLVFGNSGFGVYKEIGPWMYDILIDIRGIQELYKIEFTPSLVWGANLTLTNIHDLCDKARSNASLPYAAVFAEHIKKVANNGVRNLASWAGNLMLKHKHPEFLSDIYTMLDVVGTRLLIGDETGNRSQCTLKEFLSLDMQGKVIEAALLPTYTDTNYYIRLYRVSQRLQADHGHVIAGFNMKIDKTNNCTVLQRPTIVFQGISGTLNRAENTEAFLEGKQLGDPQVLRDSLSMLNMELTPASSPLLASADYRRSTAMSFFYKYVLDVCGDKVAQRYRSGGASLVRPVSSARHSYDTRQEEWPLNQPITSIDADYLVSGVARFLDDLPLESDELHATLVISTEGNAEIASLDAQVALSLPGVLKFIQASDFPAGGKNSFSLFGPTPEEILSSGRVEYAGQPIGIIVADDPQMASTAASMVRVTYKNVQPPLLDLRTAINQKSFFPHQTDPVIRGDPDSAIRQSPRRLTGSVEVGDQYHFHLESQSSRCAPNDTGGIDMRATTQWVDGTVKVVAEALNIPVSSVNLEVERLGGAFGGKAFRNSIVSGACALAAYIMQKPVRLVLDLHTNMKALGKRHPVIADYEVGFTEEGYLNGIKITYYSDCGHADVDWTLVFLSMFIDSTYFVQTGTSPNYCKNKQSGQHHLQSTRCRALSVRL